MATVERQMLTVGVTTRNRPQSLLRCLSSLALLGDALTEIIVVDDLSDVPVSASLAALPAVIGAKTRVVRQTKAEGYIVARNTIMRFAATDYVLLLDDDAYLIDGRVSEGVAIMDRHPDVGAIGFAQAEADGTPWPAAMQPARVSYRCRIPAYIGFAHLLRRSAFHDLGGYREELHFYGEEKGFCAQLLGAGYKVLYLPDVLVAHVPDPAGRNTSRYLRYVVRNDCLFALHNLPWPAVMVSLPARLGRFFLMSRSSLADDPAGFFWIIWQLARALPAGVRTRTPMTWSDLALWRRLRRHPDAWPA